MNHSYLLFVGSTLLPLGEQIAMLSNKPIGKWQLQRFKDGELRPIIKEDVQEVTVFLLQSTYPPAENMVELLLLSDAAKNAGAKRIIALTPYLGYMRQDKIHYLGESYGAALQLRLLATAGVDQVITCNPHTTKIPPFSNNYFKAIYTYCIFIPYLKTLPFTSICFVAPDAGAIENAIWYAHFFKTELITCQKIRTKPNAVAEMQIMGDVQGKHVVIVDDIIDTGNTIYTLAAELERQGASSVRAICTHPIFSADAYTYLSTSCLEEIVVTNTVNISQKHAKVKVLDITPLLLNTIQICLGKII